MPEPEDRDVVRPPSEPQTEMATILLLGDHQGTLPSTNPASPDPESLDPGMGRVGPYVLRQELRRWRSGTVYRATHSQLKRDVELQLLDASASQADRNAFLDSARKIAQLNSPYVARDLLEAGIADGSAYLARELAKGNAVTGFGPRGRARSTDELLYPNPELAASVCDAASAVAAVHDAGLTLGRINAETLRRDATGRLQVFGLGETPDHAVDDRQALADTFAAWVCPPKTQLPADQWVADLRRINPGVSRTLSESVARCRAGAASAAELVDAAEPVARRILVPTTFADRGFSMIVEFFILSVCWLVGLLMFSAFLQGTARTSGIIVGLAAIMLIYFPFLETVLRNTPFRWLRGFHPVDASGETPSRWRLLARSMLRLLSLAIVIGSLLALGAWLAPDKPSTSDSMILVSVLMPALGLLLYYTPTILRRDKLSLHDRLTGVFLAQKVAFDEQPQRSTTLTTPAKFVTREARIGEADPQITLSSSDVPTGGPVIPLSGSVDQYDIDRLLGEGGMASVYLVRDRHLGRVAALKVVRAGAAEASSLERFRREAELSAQIDHAHVAKVIGAGRMPDNTGLYFVMEYLPGRNLAQIVRAGGPVDVAQAWDWVIQAAEGLRAADQLGIIHRDIKPSNLMLTETNTLKVTDFGLSKALGDVDDAPSSPAKDWLPADAHLTRTGGLLGTPMFMSPEQAEGRPLDRRSDMYSLGLTLLNLLTGRAPYPTSSVPELLNLQAMALPPRLSQPIAGLTPERRAVLLKMLAKDTNDRHADYDSLLRDLRRTAPRPWRYARFRWRAWAEFANCIIVFLPLFLIVLCLTITETVETDDDTRWEGIATVGTAIFCWMYVWGVGRHGSTLGKRLNRLKVVGLNGEHIGLWRAALRFVVAYPGIQVQVLVAAAFYANAISKERMQSLNLWMTYVFYLNVLLIAFMTWWHPQRRTVHDLAAGTVVIRLDPDQIEPRPGWRKWMPW